MKRVLIITPYYPYPAEKNGGIHTLNALIKNMPDRVVDVFYYGETKSNEKKFTDKIENVYNECLLKKSKINYLISILNRRTYTIFRFKNKSNILKTLNKKEYDEVYFDQYSSIQYLKYFKEYTKLINIAHDSMPLYFKRKKELSKNILLKIYYYLQQIFSKKEEKTYYRFFKKIIYLSNIDVEYEQKMHPEISSRFYESNIGIDLEEVNEAPLIKLPDKTIIFTGVMDYSPNHDAMIYFINNIWDKLYEKDNELYLYIVGKNPTKELTDLCKLKRNIICTGKVINIFSYIKSSRLYISPLRFGTGKKNKVLEALACNTPLIASKVSLEGFKNISNCVLTANSDAEWENQILNLINNDIKYKEMKKNMKNVINKDYNWKIITKKIVD